MHIRWLTFLCFMSVLLGPVPVQADCHYERVEDFIETYGRADADDAQVKRVKAIFKDVSQMADKNKHRWPQLVIINLKDSPLAIALKNGIVLSQQAIQLSYQNVSPSEGDARMAFILGHELAHLAFDDFWHREFFCALKDHQALKKTLQSYQERDGKAKEIAADDRGFIYAAMAGYAVEQLVQADKDNFLLSWQQQPQMGDNHPDAQLRLKALRARLEHLLKQVSFFNFGVRLSHFDRCHDGQYFLQAFSEVFPAPEVFNNLGYCYLQSAQKILAGFITATEHHYCLPLMLEVTTQAQALSSLMPSTLRGLAEAPLKAEEFLTQAQQYLTTATQANPEYVPAWVNLAVTQLYRQEIYAARQAVEKAYQLAPNQLDIQGLRAVIIYEEGRSLDTWPNAITLLKKLAQDPQTTPCILYNTATLMAQRDRSGAQQFWQQLLKRRFDLPLTVQRRLCAQQDCAELTPQATVKQWSLPLTPGTFLTPKPKILQEWNTIAFDFVKEVYGEIYQAPDDSLELLALAGFAELIVLKKIPQDVSLTAYCQYPLRTTRVMNRVVKSCSHWAALIEDENIEEIWIVKDKNR